MGNLLQKDLLFYAVTDRSWLRGEKLSEVVKKALDGGVTCLQLREKHLTRDAFLREALEVRKITEQYKVPFLINDSVEIALEAGADGVHIGQKDMEPQKARELLGADKIIGVTARTVAQALAAEKSGADYLGSGAAFTTKTKQDAIPMTEETMNAICEAVEIPVVAIGGITYENMEQLSGRKIAGVAVVSSLFAAEDVYAQAVKMRKRAEALFF